MRRWHVGPRKLSANVARSPQRPPVVPDRLGQLRLQASDDPGSKFESASRLRLEIENPWRT